MLLKGGQTSEEMQAMDHDNSGEMHYYNLSAIQTATNNFSYANKLGEGGFGPVYKVKRQIFFFFCIHMPLCYPLHLKIKQ